MSFAVTAEAYDRFMGRYSIPLAPVFADFAGIIHGMRALDVGCGPGALTSALVDRLGSASVAAVDPSPSFVEAMRARHPEVDTISAEATDLPFADGEFDAALAQLVVHFMPDPIAGIREMTRVTRAGGVIAACVWDHAGGSGPLSLFWEVVRSVDSTSIGETKLPGASEGDLAKYFERAGLRQVEQARLDLVVVHATFEDWWHPFTLGVGPAGSYVATLSAERRSELEAACRAVFPPVPYSQPASAWAARGLVHEAAKPRPL